MIRYVIGLDLGTQQDYTAVSILDSYYNVDLSAYYHHLVYLDRPPKKTPYPVIVQQIVKLMNEDRMIDNSKLVVDATGAGLPVVQELQKAGLRPLAITITGGNTPGWSQWPISVPKRDLVTNLQLVFQSKRIKIAGGIKLAKEFQAELMNFRVKINKRTNNDSYEAWRDSEHDDIVLSVSLATWYIEQCRPPLRRIEGIAA